MPYKPQHRLARKDIDYAKDANGHKYRVRKTINNSRTAKMHLQIRKQEESLSVEGK